MSGNRPCALTRPASSDRHPARRRRLLATRVRIGGPLAARAWIGGLVLVLAASTAMAQQPPASRERELLRRSQAALREATAQRDAAVAEKDALLQARDKLLAAQRDEADRFQARIGGASQALATERQRARGEIDALKAEIAQLRQAQAAQSTASGERTAAFNAQRAELQRELAARTQANQQVSALLTKATAALATSEQRNAGLHALALELVERWRTKGPAEQALQAEPVFGIGAVRAESQAEAWRSRIDALQPAGP